MLLAIVGTAAALGTIHSTPGQDVPASTWAKDLALAGLGFGFLLDLLMPGGLSRRGRWLVPLTIGSGTYAIAYFISHAVSYGGGDETDTGGMGFVIVVFTIVCLAPMAAAAAVGGLIHVAVARTRADD